MYIRKHSCESKPKFTNMQGFSSILQCCIRNLDAQWKPKPQFTHKKQINFTIFISIFTSILVNPYQNSNMQNLSSILQVCISNLHAQCKPKPQLTHKNSLFAYMYIHKHHCESKPKLTNMQSLSIMLQACIQLKKIK